MGRVGGRGGGGRVGGFCYPSFSIALAVPYASSKSSVKYVASDWGTPLSERRMLYFPRSRS
jgi:hypothetical protein